MTAIAERVKSLDSDEMPILCIGISVVGLVDYRRQEIRLAANLPFLDGKSLGHDLSQRLGVDCVLVHDAHALCLAEYVYGEASNLDSFAVLDMSTGIGLGVMVNNMFLTGHSGFAGEMGHIPIVPNGSIAAAAGAAAWKRWPANGRSSNGCPSGSGGPSTLTKSWSWLSRATSWCGRS